MTKRVLAIVVTLGLAVALEAAGGEPGAFRVRTTTSGRRIAFWEGTAPPTPAALKALLRRRALAAAHANGSDAISAYGIDAIALDSLGEVRFAKGSARLTAESARELERTCAAFSADEELRRVRFRTVGHSCALGPSAFNRRLSAARARSVALYLERCLGGADRIAGAEGRGEDELLASESPESPLQRRVELVLVQPFDPPPPID